MWKNLTLFFAGMLLGSGTALAEPERENDRRNLCAEGQEPIQLKTYVSGIDPMASPSDSVIVLPKKKTEQPSYEPGIGLVTFWIGVIAMCAGYFSPIGILIAGGVFTVIGVLLLLFYRKIKDKNPFEIRGRNIVAKILLAIFFFLFLFALMGVIIMAFVIALALLLAAVLSSVVSPIVVAGVIMGIGVVWMLAAAVIYLIKYRRYKKSLKNG